MFTARAQSEILVGLMGARARKKNTQIFVEFLGGWGA
jgi:hypothetical protein